MRSTYDQVMPRVLAHEGGFVDHPADPGGATNKGVTQATYDRFRQRRGLTKRSVSRIEAAEVAAIYSAGYWEPILGDLLPAGVDYATFDAAVNSGVPRASRWLQRAVGAEQDGKVGRRDTVPRAQAASDKAAVVRRICAYRLSFMQGLRIWKSFGRGWARRVAEVEAVAVALALKAGGSSEAAVVAAARAEVDNAERAGRNATRRAAASGTAGATSGVAGAADAGANISALPGWVFAALSAALIIAAFALLWRARVQKARAAAYRQRAEE